MASHSDDPLNVIVIGAGLGGLAAAIGILNGGHRVTVLEAAQEIGEIGAGIQVSANGTAQLIRWGLEESLSKYATTPDYTFLRRWQDGKVLTKVDMFAYAKKFNAPFWDFHRANLHQILLEKTLDLGGVCLVKKAVKDIDFAAPSVLCEDGTVYHADLVIGADGVNGRSRDLLAGKPDPPRETGDLAYRLMIDADKIHEIPSLCGLLERPRVNYHIGHDKHCVSYILRGGKFLNMVLLAPDNMPEGARLTPGTVEEMQKTFEGWDPIVTQLLALVDVKTNMVKWRLCIRDEIPSWTHSDNKFAFLGDSVHATLPYMSQGAAMCFEDAGVLETVLRKVSNAKKNTLLPLALRAYEQSRIKRTARVVEGGLTHQHYWHLPDGPEQEIRDAQIGKEPPEPGCTYRWKCPEFSTWLFGYDAVAEAEESWRKVTLPQINPLESP